MATFAQVVETGGFTAAARSMGQSKSAVSKAVAKLEGELGVQLLHRTTRQVAPTEIGAAFYGRCARMLEEAASAEALVGCFRDEPRGTLRVNAPITFGRKYVTGIVAAFQDAWPAVDIELTLQDDYVDLLESGSDVAVRLGRLADSSLIARKLGSVGCVVVASPEYLAAHGTPAQPSELVTHNWLRYALSPAPDRLVFEDEAGRHQVRVVGDFVSNSGDAILDMALRGRGMTMLPAFYVDDALAAGTLRVVLGGFRLTSAAVYAVYPQARHVAPKLRAFIDHLAEHCTRWVTSG